MLATFCLRLALGLAASLLVLTPADVAPRFFRTQFLVILGLLAGAAFFLWPVAPLSVTLLVVLGMILSFVASIIWMLEGAPGGTILTVSTVLLLLGVSVLQLGNAWSVVDDWTSAALLGGATSAMLMGHSYLVAPAMSIQPLLRLLVLLFTAVGLRSVIAGLSLSAVHFGGAELLWLPVRWGVGLLGPLILGAMAWQCARIRSTQSATGILYVVVILCFIGELTDMLYQGAPRPREATALAWGPSHHEAAFRMSDVRPAGSAEAAGPRR